MKSEKNCNIGNIRSDHGKEHENANFAEFYNRYSIKHEFSAPIIPEQIEFYRRWVMWC